MQTSRQARRPLARSVQRHHGAALNGGADDAEQQYRVLTMSRNPEIVPNPPTVKARSDGLNPASADPAGPGATRELMARQINWDLRGST